MYILYCAVHVYASYITGKDSLHFYYHNQVNVSSITVGAHVAAAASAASAGVLSTTHQLYALPVCVTRSRHSHRIDYNILLMLPFTSFHFYTHTVYVHKLSAHPREYRAKTIIISRNVSEREIQAQSHSIHKDLQFLHKAQLSSARTIR